MSSQIHRFEDFELDRGHRELRREDTVVHLERIPFEFLCLLVERTGQIVTRSEIIERVWGKDVFLDSESSVNTAMRKIRRALNDDSDPPRFVATLPGKGYRFIARVQTLNGELKKDSEALQSPSITTSKQGVEEGVGKSWRPRASLAAGVVIIIAAVSLLMRYQWPAIKHQSSELASVHGKARELAGEASLAVLPLVNLTNQLEPDSVIDGLTDDVINGLTRQSRIFVIARTSSFTYKGRAIKAPEIGRELGVKYLLEGSVHRAANGVRVDTELVDTATGGVVWAERYDRSLPDTFALPDEIVQEVDATLRHRAGYKERDGSGNSLASEAWRSCHNLADFGAFPDDGIDDTAPSQKALEEASVRGGDVCFGRGRWRLSGASLNPRTSSAALSIHGSHVEIRGVGTETVLEVVGDQRGAGMGVISVNSGAHDIAIRDLTIDTSATTNTSEQFHAIVIGNGLGNGTVEDVRIEHVGFDHPAPSDGSRKGDCLHIVGNTPDEAVRRVSVIGATFVSCASSDISIQQNVSDFYIQRNPTPAGNRDIRDIDNDRTHRTNHL
jgi:TolB-like protein/DNA-binding winged helix-turn-helix (wHTH) protein